MMFAARDEGSAHVIERGSGGTPGMMALGVEKNRSWRTSFALILCGGLLGACDGSGLASEGAYYGDNDGDQYVPPPEDPARPDDPEAACNADEDVTLYLSPDDSNSMSSPVQAREAIRGNLGSLYSTAIRTYEFMNYYGFDYPAAPPGEVTVSTALAAAAEEGGYTLQIAVTSESMTAQDRAPMSITLVLDTSGSMSGHAMDMLKESCRVIASSLQEGDTISMVTWDTANQIVLEAHPVTGPDDAVLREHIEGLEAGGGTNLHGGLVAGYDLAEEAWKKDQINRIVLVSDGGANAGVTDHDLIAEHADRNGEEGIFMVGVGVGTAATYNDQLMDAVTDAGKGASVFINDAIEARHIFDENFISTFSVAARDVSVQLDMPPGFSVTRFSGEEISENAAEVEPQHLALNDTMVFHQKIETCAPELVDQDATISVTVRYLDAITYQEREAKIEARFADMLETPDARLLKGAAVFEYAEALKLFRDGDRSGISTARAAVDRAQQVAPDDEDLLEIDSVLAAL